MSVSIAVRVLPHAAGLPLPHYATPGAAGMDLIAAVSDPVTIPPGGRECVSGAAEDPVGEVGRTERRKARQPLLLFGAGMAGFRLDRRHESDRGEIVLCARFPTVGKTALAGEPVVLRRKRWFGGNRRVEGFGLFGLDIVLRIGGGFRSWESAKKAEALRNDRGVEEGQGELVMFHGERS